MRLHLPHALILVRPISPEIDNHFHVIAALCAMELTANVFISRKIDSQNGEKKMNLSKTAECKVTTNTHTQYTAHRQLIAIEKPHSALLITHSLSFVSPSNPKVR